ncbi:hypothetical protein EOA60_36935 [Mesorhizobium sp. M1A.F.Ca.IN.020.06.1.1]|nr:MULTISPECIES: hypothetical protein [unclassified Mesorhizobium]RUW00874.1 hypothetical protein EOA46_33260 [Mesorhizobium sp. M1A.F.Ca.IN.022.05.2.1]RUV80338.1 hypothetical protein EOA51_33050 [Mesorhizobium sp. M1A.F.Ca.IN.020.32.1.1]RUW05000.1 hypothetical protein EOA60_36935 [Mesorhizobium sp. M1A.F.Ca.IN.020.06.1.1]RWF83136.1 MAG: hypothetical protein EOQ35_07505 [Mesorhizobium sp.]RWG06716.1 MAG: hypothetical protein EOQ38_00995 [Mesorhizobium sp.]
MAGIEMRFNGRKLTSATQLQRELTRSMEKHIKDSLKKAAGPGVRMKKTRDGYVFEGRPEQIERMKKRLR